MKKISKKLPMKKWFVSYFWKNETQFGFGDISFETNKFDIDKCRKAIQANSKIKIDPPIILNFTEIK